MDDQPNGNQTSDALQNYDQERRDRAGEILLMFARAIFGRRYFIIGLTAFIGLLSIGISLMLPKWYTASTRLLSPESGSASPISAAMLRNLSSAASSILGIGGGADYERYIAIMTSRTLREKVVEKYDLITVYEKQESENPMGDAVEMLGDNTDISIDIEFGYLTISVTDLDPERAAEIANFYVEELNRVNLELSSKNAAHYRKFVEQRYNEVLDTLEDLKQRTQRFQEKYGVFDIEVQATGFFEQLAAMRTEEIALEIEYQALLTQYGQENGRVITARQVLRAAQQKTKAALDGQEQILPVAQDSVPSVTRQYLQLEQEALIQKSLLEVIAPLYDQARFQEERTFQAVQVIDTAIPPKRKAKPKRSIIVIVATISGFCLVLLYVLAQSWWKHNSATLRQHLLSITHSDSAR